MFGKKRYFGAQNICNRAHSNWNAVISFPKDNRAQISIEYMVVIAFLIAVAALVALLAANFFSMKNQTKEINSAMASNLKKMWSEY